MDVENSMVLGGDDGRDEIQPLVRNRRHDDALRAERRVDYTEYMRIKPALAFVLIEGVPVPAVAEYGALTQQAQAI